jgi:hypothetical protein
MLRISLNVATLKSAFERMVGSHRAAVELDVDYLTPAGRANGCVDPSAFGATRRDGRHLPRLKL